jgi:hypothetical protein
LFRQKDPKPLTPHLASLKWRDANSLKSGPTRQAQTSAARCEERPSFWASRQASDKVGEEPLWDSLEKWENRRKDRKDREGKKEAAVHLLSGALAWGVFSFLSFRGLGPGRRGPFVSAKGPNKGRALRDAPCKTTPRLGSLKRRDANSKKSGPTRRAQTRAARYQERPSCGPAGRRRKKVMCGMRTCGVKWA